jgi:beta-glucosidase
MRQLMQFKAPENSAFLDIDIDSLEQHDIKIMTVLDGIKAAVSGETKIMYARGCENLSSDTTGFAQAAKAAEEADVVVLVLGDRSGLTPDCTAGETRDSADLKLPGVQEELALAILSTGKPVAIVLTTGRPYVLSALAERANAILQAWLPGEEGGTAVAEILFGDASPGGKLPVTFPRSAGQLPLYYNAKPAGARSHWYGDYVAEKVTPLYSFGHGLSYTSFAYGELMVGKQQVTAGESVEISLKVENTGQVPGEEVVQLYTHDEFASTPRPVKELRGYVRIALQPGEARLVIFNLPVDQLAFYNNDLELVLEPGAIDILVGSSSKDIRLCGRLEILGGSKMVVDRRVFFCPVDVNKI